MESIYIGFSYRVGSAVSKTIQIVDGSTYSHVYIRRKSKYGEYIYQASGLQVNFMNADIFRENNVIVEEYEFQLDSDKKDKIISFFMKYAGTNYGLKFLFKILAVLLCRRVGYNLKLSGDGDKTFICSELGALFAKEILEIPIDDNIDFMTPKDLNPIIKSHGKKVI